jgi:hypothetical protein
MNTALRLRWHELLLIVFFMLCIGHVNAQSEKTGTYGGAGYFGFRMMKYNFANLNTAFSTNNLPVISENILSFGGGGHGYIDRVIVGGEGFSYVLSDKNNGTYTTQARGEIGFANIGYLLINNNKFMLAPIFGVGASTLTIDINDNTVESFNQLLSNPKKGTRLRNDQFLLDLGVKADLFLTKRKFFAAGVKVGYMYAPVESSWTDVNKVAIDGPTLNADAAYLQLHLTFGGFSN